MKIDLTKLLNGFIEEVSFNETIEFDDEYIKRTEIRRIEPVNVKGSIRGTMNDLYTLNMIVEGKMILPCSVSLEDVEFPFNIETTEILSEKDEEDQEYIKINENSIDILPIVWQNIVMEIPLKVVSPNLDRRNISGIGWKLISEEDTIDNKEEI
jgi:uncharacterized protein